MAPKLYFGGQDDDLGLHVNEGRRRRKLAVRDGSGKLSHPHSDDESGSDGDGGSDGGSDGGGGEGGGGGSGSGPNSGKNSKELPVSNTENTEKSHSVSGTASAPSSTSSPLPFLCLTSACIQDNSPTVRYSPTWSIASLPFAQTIHQTTVVGASLSLSFNGTGIKVFGTIPVSNATSPPPTAVYVVDAASPLTTTQPMATSALLDQPLFSADDLYLGQHTLVLNVTSVVDSSPFSVDYFVLDVPPSASASASGSSASFAAASASASASQIPSNGNAKVLAGVLSAVIFLLFCIISMLVFVLRMRRKRSMETRSLQSSLFTHPESILRWSYVPSLRSDNLSRFAHSSSDLVAHPANNLTEKRSVNSLLSRQL
uniref:Uncharacterized protein n=1 Tax=Mycena chlorophos TaxID=658473 RepID=A0ABQ0LNB3_MYCCL|nr:predicted protein [Mycena chlorophos]